MKKKRKNKISGVGDLKKERNIVFFEEVDKIISSTIKDYIKP